MFNNILYTKQGPEFDDPKSDDPKEMNAESLKKTLAEAEEEVFDMDLRAAQVPASNPDAPNQDSTLEGQPPEAPNQDDTLTGQSPILDKPDPAIIPDPAKEKEDEHFDMKTRPEQEPGYELKPDPTLEPENKKTDGMGMTVGTSMHKPMPSDKSTAAPEPEKDDNNPDADNKNDPQNKQDKRMEPFGDYWCKFLYEMFKDNEPHRAIVSVVEKVKEIKHNIDEKTKAYNEDPSDKNAHLSDQEIADQKTSLENIKKSLNEDSDNNPGSEAVSPGVVQSLDNAIQNLEQLENTSANERPAEFSPEMNESIQNAHKEFPDFEQRVGQRQIGQALDNAFGQGDASGDERDVSKKSGPKV